MLLHAWQGFTHIGPLQGNVDHTLFDGRLKDIVVEARLELNERTDEEVREIADRIAKCFADCPNGSASSSGELLPIRHSDVLHTDSMLSSPDDKLLAYYGATLALMLANEALRLDGPDSAIAAIDAQEIITCVTFFKCVPREGYDALITASARKTVAKRNEPLNKLKTHAIQLARDERKQYPALSLYKITGKIRARVEQYGCEIGRKLSPERAPKTILEWLTDAEL